VAVAIVFITWIYIPIVVPSVPAVTDAARPFVRGMDVTLPLLTAALILADRIRQRRRGQQRLSAAPVILAVTGSAVLMGTMVELASLSEKEAAAAIGLGFPFLFVPPLLVTVSVVHWSASRKLDATPDRD